MLTFSIFFFINMKDSPNLMILVERAYNFRRNKHTILGGIDVLFVKIG